MLLSDAIQLLPSDVMVLSCLDIALRPLWLHAAVTEAQG